MKKCLEVIIALSIIGCAIGCAIGWAILPYTIAEIKDQLKRIADSLEKSK